MNKEDIAYCGLNCELCQERFNDIREKAKSLNESLDNVNFDEIAKLIPFMKHSYKGYKKTTGFFMEECPGCRNKGGNPFCGIRKCAAKRGYFSCAECDVLCRKFNKLFKVHADNEIQNNIKKIKEAGIEEFMQS